MNMILRPADMRDAYALWLWANDAATRTASYGRAPILWRDHVLWLQRVIVDPGHATLVAVSQEEQPLGSIRFDTADEWKSVRLSYVIAPEMRGNRLSGPLIVAGIDWLRWTSPGTVVQAEVLRSNLPSLRAFRSLGWREGEADDRKVVFRWSDVEERDETRN